ncbi:hypothetical protein [Vannielia sp. SX4]|uniref:hypothetical protein n=1 Tax=Vannielia sp. SX4 TaxID=3463852 RepID=UPI004059AF86
MSEALWALVGVIVGGLLTGCVELFLQRRQFQHEIRLLKQQRLGAEVAKEILTEMLNHKSYVDRSFQALRRPIGGFTDEEVRQMLHEVNARRVEREDGSEWWFLRSRAEERQRNPE